MSLTMTVLSYLESCTLSSMPAFDWLKTLYDPLLAVARPVSPRFPVHVGKQSARTPQSTGIIIIIIIIV